MTNYNNWKINVKIEDERFIDDANCHLNWKKEIFELQIGLIPRIWDDRQYTKKDIPLLENHEFEHALMMIEGIDKGCMNPLWANCLSERIEIYNHILDIEKRAWRRVFNSLTYTPINWLEKAQSCLNAHLMNSPPAIL